MVSRNVARAVGVGSGMLVGCWLLLLSGCMNRMTDPRDEEIAQSAEELRRAQILAEQHMQTTISADRAKQLAARHLSLKQARWGDPVAIREDDQHYYVSYQTPERELRLIGARVLIVDKSTGVVTQQKRR